MHKLQLFVFFYKKVITFLWTLALSYRSSLRFYLSETNIFYIVQD